MAIERSKTQMFNQKSSDSGYVYAKRFYRQRLPVLSKVLLVLLLGSCLILMGSPNSGETGRGTMFNGIQHAIHSADSSLRGSFETINSNNQCRKSSEKIILPHYSRTEDIENVRLNRTLGFEKVFVLNLPRRTDRRDLMALMGLASDVKLDFFDASSGSDIEFEKLPEIKLHEDLRERNLTQGQLACYRSNLDIMRFIVENRISSALILQDDADWDIDFRLGLERLQKPFSQLLQGMKEGPLQCDSKVREDNPWSSNEWDIFWLGSSYELPWPDAKTAPYVLYDDDLVTGQESIERGGKTIFQGYGLKRARQVGDPLQRLVQRSRRPVAMAAYAVTLSGAATILNRGTRMINQPFDSTVCSLSRVNTPDYRSDGCILTPPIAPPGQSTLRSYSVWPPLVNQFRSADGARDSDLNDKRIHIGSRPGSAGFALEIKNGLREGILEQKFEWNYL